MPDLYTLSRVSPLSDPYGLRVSPLVHQVQLSRRTCTGTGRKPAHVPGTPVLLGWPVLWTCSAPKHNTLEAARPRKHRPRCTCPRGHQLYMDMKAVERDKARERRPSVSRSEASRNNALQAAASRAANAERLKRELEAALQDVPRLSGDEPACHPDLLPAGVNRDDFFREGRSEADKRRRGAARRVCYTCPIQAACLKKAVERGEEYGIFGGLDERERRNPHRVAAELRAIAH